MEKMNTKTEYPIDIVITWVDGRDGNWLKIKNQYATEKELSNPSSGGDERFCDDGLFKYVFRGIDKFVPWVNKVFLVTWGHLPDWLNVSNKKLIIIKHEDFMPTGSLPVFNGNSLSLNFHRIKGLSEHFIYVNDDMYFIAPTKKSIFFKKGKPCDMACQKINETKFYQDMYYFNVHNDLCLLNMMFKKKEVIRKHFFKWFNHRYGIKHNIRNICLLPFNLFSGIYEPHTPAPYLKSNIEKVWNIFGKELLEATMEKFRSPYDCTENIFRYYAMSSGDFYPINRDRYGFYFLMNDIRLSTIIRKQKYNMICINRYDASNFDKVLKSFNSILPDKSSFEK